MTIPQDLTAPEGGQAEPGTLTAKYAQQIEKIIACYPPDYRRAAVMPLLYLAQHEYGYLPQHAIDEVAGLVGINPTEAGGLVRFYTLYHAEPGGKYRVQVCTDLPCALKGAEKFADDLASELGIEGDEVTEDGLFSLERVMCLAACHRAPMFQIQDSKGIHYHENQTVESALQVLGNLKSETADG